MDETKGWLSLEVWGARRARGNYCFERQFRVFIWTVGYAVVGLIQYI